MRNTYDIEEVAKTLFLSEVDVDDDEFAYYAEESKKANFQMPDDIVRYLYFRKPNPSLWLEDLEAFAKFLGIEDPEHYVDPTVPLYHMDLHIINGRLAIEWWELPKNW